MKSKINSVSKKTPNDKNIFLYNVFRGLMIFLSVIFCIWFILPVFIYGIINTFNIMGILACIYVFLFYTFRNTAKNIRHKFYKKSITKFLWKIGRLCIYAFTTYGLLISIVMIIFANITPSENATAIILGAQVKGTRPTLSLYDRIVAGEKYLEENPKAVCVTTGGLGDTAEITEAQCMYNVMVEEGIDRNRIFLENNATSTKENIVFSYEIIKEINANENIAIVSDGFHQFRARIIARKSGITGNIGAISAKTNLIYLPTFWIREWFAIPYDIFFR